MDNVMKEIMQRTEQALGYQNSTAIVLTRHGTNDWEAYFPGCDYSVRGTRQDALKEINNLMEDNVSREETEMNNKQKKETITLATYPDMFLDNDCKVENENYENEFREFTVPLCWAVEWMKSECHQTLDEFLDEYTWDETIQMYEDAMHQNVLCATEILTV